jgi:hypothetical protein
MSETRGQYLTVIKYLNNLAISDIPNHGKLFYDRLSNLELSGDSKVTMNIVKCSNSMFDKIYEMEEMAKNSPSYLDEPILESELIDLNTLGLYLLD